MRYTIIILAFALGCTNNEPNPVSVPPKQKDMSQDLVNDMSTDMPKDVAKDIPTSNDMSVDQTKDQTTDQDKDQSTMPGVGKITTYKWILRDKDNNIVDAMVAPYTPLNFQENLKIEIKEPGPATTEGITGVGILSIGGRRPLVANLYSLATGQPLITGDCSYIYLNDQCTDRALNVRGLCRSESGSIVAGYGPPIRDVSASVWLKSGETCREIDASNGGRYTYAPRLERSPPNWVFNVLPNAPYTMSYEKD